MSESSLTRMADILPPEISAQTPNYGDIWVGFILVFFALFFYFAKRWWAGRTCRLLKAVRSGKLSTRTAAHQLSRDKNLTPRLREKLDRIRFQAKLPTLAELEAIVDEAEQS